MEEVNQKKSFIASLSKYRTHALVLLIYLVISLVMFWQVTINFGSMIINGAGDAYQSLFNLWWVPFSIFTLHQSPYFTYALYFPIGANLVSQTMTPLAGILTWPITALSRASAYNVLFFSSFALSGLFMFMLADHFVKNRHAAFLAGLIYAFSPVHIAQAYSHLQWTIIEWIPLFILFMYLTVKEKSWKYPILAAVCFILLTFMGDIEQGILMVFFTILLLIVMLIFKEERHALLRTDTILHLGLFVLLVLLIGSPFFISMAPHLSGAALNTTQVSSGTLSNMLWSDNLLSFFLPSPYNGVFHGISLSYANQIYSLFYSGLQYEFNITERTSYIGYSVILLCLIGLYYDFKQNRFKHTAIWLILGVVFALLALGPYLQIYNGTTGVPGLYLLYRAIPLFNLIREPGRFDFIVTISLALLAAFGFAHISKGKEKRTSLNYMILFTALILIEYNGIPLSSQLANSLLIPTAIPKAYTELASVPGNFSVLILPILPNSNSSTPELYPGLATYYESATQRPIIGGYTTRANDTQELSVQYIPLAVSALYLQYGQGLIYPSPVNTNVTNTTIFWLANDRVGYISMIRSAYNLSQQDELYTYLGTVFGNPVYQDNTTIVFSTAAVLNAEAGKSFVAYPIGTWIPGYEFCNAPEECNLTIESMWFGANVRSLNLYSPTTSTMNMSFEAISYGVPSTMYIFSGTQRIAGVNLTNTTGLYSLKIPVTQGVSQLTFYEPNDTSSYARQPQYLNFGIENITFNG